MKFFLHEDGWEEVLPHLTTASSPKTVDLLVSKVSKRPREICPCRADLKKIRFMNGIHPIELLFKKRAPYSETCFIVHINRHLAGYSGLRCLVYRKSPLPHGLLRIVTRLFLCKKIRCNGDPGLRIPGDCFFPTDISSIFENFPFFPASITNPIITSCQITKLARLPRESGGMCIPNLLYTAPFSKKTSE